MTGIDGADWWRGCVIYQVYPRSFQDTTGDGIGDLPGVTARLPYIASLDVDAIWLSPFFKSPMADMGYDVSDYRDVDPMFGTLEDFDRLVAEAHRLGLKVFIDQVLSHTSDRHPWFRESRADRKNARADWYVWADPKPDGTPPNNWLSVFGGSAWEWDGMRKQYYLHNFLASQPDLNFHNGEVQDALLETVRFWLERGVDGFRVDAVNFHFHDRSLADNPPVPAGKISDVPDTNPYGYQEHLHDKTQPENIGFLKRFRALLDAYGGRAAVGEVGDGDRSLRTVAAYTEGGDKLHMCYTFDLLSPEFSAGHVRHSVEAFETAVAGGWICWAFSNHDVVRHVSRWVRPGGSKQAIAKFSIGLLSALRGSICLYQGEELGFEEADIAFEDLRDPYGIRFWPAFKGRDGCRTPMAWEHSAANAGFTTGKPWLPVPAAHAAQAVDIQRTLPGSVLDHYRDVLAFRGQHPALRNGTIEFLESDSQDVLAFLRKSGNEALLCVFNFSEDPAGFSIPPVVGTVSSLDFPGQEAVLSSGEVQLPGLGVFFGRVD
ncbi:alpha-glucosidase [Mesorhizobium sp. L-8-10]|uniref:beta-galactosidase BglA n=1 Tax=unclassified Mesorhizobium TaxID=325217 RepID=UPI0019268250|nr:MULTISPECIES: alpha-glucosidase family protein [unclassified Mesorhizobium]BCH26066.1 alpha-glucosidase [Mesorhizobium sp. L-8-3]BCH34056.1 alpha-glucosidase [Mesorhizobium sp. L-8-10]